MSTQIDFDEIRHEEMQADFERQAEWAERANERCVDCTWSGFLPMVGNSDRFMARVGDRPNGLGVCALDGDYVGITTADTALSMDCDAWEEEHR